MRGALIGGSAATAAKTLAVGHRGFTRVDPPVLIE
jgi:hypothetical protein